MPTYSYPAERGRNRTMERLVWVIMGVMVAFLLLSTFHPAVKAHISSNPGNFTVGLVVLYLMFLIFSRRMFRQQRLAGVRLATTRRNFTFNDLNGEKIHSWRDVKEATMRVEVDRRGSAYVRRMTLDVPKARITLDNDPLVPLQHAPALLAELRDHVARVVWRFHWYHPVCPLCKGRLDTRAKVCQGCGERVVYVSKLMRPWEIFREENLYVFLLLLVAAPSFPALYPLALVFVATIVMVAMLTARVDRLRPIVVGEEAEAPAPTPGGGATAVTVGLCMAASLLLCGAPAQAAPASSASPAVRPVPWPWNAAPSAAPRKPDSTWFPLAVGNTWEYRSNFDTVTMRVTQQEIVNGTMCWVVESTVGDSAETVQREYYSVGPAGIEVTKRTHKGSDFFLDTPEPMLSFPLREGRHWTWQGNAGQGAVMLAFEVKGERRVPVLGRDTPALLVVIRGRSVDGSEIQTKRWYCRGIGMVREQSIMKKSGKSTTMEATLQNYSLRVGTPVRD